MGNRSIDNAEPCYKQIRIEPKPGGGFTYAKASYNSIYGRIVSDWELKDGKFKLNVTIPANTTATVYVPAVYVGSVTEGGRPAELAKGVHFLRMDNGRAVFAVGSGDYRFVSEKVN